MIKILKQTRDNNILIKGKFYDHYQGFDEDEEIDTEAVLIDEDYEFDENDEAIEFFAYMFGTTIEEIPVDNFAIDKNGNIFAPQLHTGNDFVKVDSNKELYVNKLLEEQSL